MRFATEVIGWIVIAYWAIALVNYPVSIALMYARNRIIRRDDLVDEIFASICWLPVWFIRFEAWRRGQ